MNIEIKVRLQQYIDQSTSLLQLFSAAKPRQNINQELGKNLIAYGAGEVIQDIARDLLGTNVRLNGAARKSTLKYLKEQEKLQYQAKLNGYENRFNSIMSDLISFLNSISVKRKDLTIAGNSYLLIKRLASVHNFSTLPARLRRLNYILLSIQAEQLIYNSDIPQFLAELKEKDEDRQKTAYSLLVKLETQMRLLIQTRLYKISKNWWMECIPSDIRQGAELKKQRNEKPSLWTGTVNSLKGDSALDTDLLQYVEFNDYIKIIKRADNWKNTFKEVFIDEELISAKLKELDPIRNAIAHSRNISKEQLQRLELHVNDIVRSMRKFI